MKLHDLHPTPGSRHKKKRVGRGDSSGWGKSAGRGEKGDKSRSGSVIRHHFEGGQVTFFRRLPKRGFKSMAHQIYTVINVGLLEKSFSANDTIDIALLKEKGMIGRKSHSLKILGTGEITKAMTIKAASFSDTAKSKIEAAGGKCEVV